MKKLILLIALTALASPLRAADHDTLLGKVDALPETSPDERLKKATLQWALEDAKAAQAAGLSELASATLKDVEALLLKKIGVAHPAPPNLFPRHPAFQVTQYPAAGSLDGPPIKTDRSDSLRTLWNETYKMGPDGDVVQDPVKGWVAIKIAYQAEALAMGLCHPESPYAGNPKLIAPMFRRFENAYAYMVPGNKKRLADFGPAPALSQMYLLLTTVYPDLILPSRRAAWEKAIRLNCDTILESREALFLAAKPGTAYVNCDIKYLSALAYASVIFSDDRYKKVAEAGLRLIDTAIYPDGGSDYINWQNECFTYHGILVSELARIAQVTGNKLAAEMMARTANYYPLSFVIANGANGVGEFSTSPSWKQNWNGILPGRAADLVEQTTGWPQAVSPAEKYFVYDRNIEGLRGRFGAFAFCGTARDFHDDPRGKNTYAGCIVLLVDGVPLPPGAKKESAFSAGLATAGTIVTPKPGLTGRALYSLSSREHNSTIVTRDFATLTTAHQLGAYGAAQAADWGENEVWLFLPDRMIGLVAVESLKDQTAAGIIGDLEYVSPKAGGDVIEAAGTDAFKSGLLNTRLREHDYAQVKADPAPAKFTHLRLLDHAGEGADAGKMVPYPKGARHFYLVELYPDGAQPAEGVTRLHLDNGLLGFEVKAAGVPVTQVVFNPTAASAVCKLTAARAGSTIHRNGEQYRPAWISPEHKEQITSLPAAMTASDVAGGITIPAFAHFAITANP